jgi:hypothetical protein
MWGTRHHATGATGASGTDALDKEVMEFSKNQK